jgi:hypothetical protein
MGYRKGLVYFIDVLGTKNRSFEELFDINKTFHSELKNVQERHNPKSVGDRCVMTFSDCAYIIYALKDEFNDNEDILLKYLYTSLYNTATTIAIFLSNGFLCRGGVSYGDVYFDKENNILFGPAVNKAYQLESSECARMPRLLIDEDLANKIITFDSNVKSQNQIAQITNGDIIIKDPKDNKYFLNYLNVFSGVEWVMLNKKSFNFELFYNEAKKYSETTINQTNNEDVKNKHNWQLEYLERINTQIVNSTTLTEKEFVDILLKNI